MTIYFFSDTDWKRRLRFDESTLNKIFYQIADGSNTEDLILANYLLHRNSWSGGVAYTRDWLSPKQFVTYRGRWKFTQKFGIPNDIPGSFKLIRLQFGIKGLKYPLCQIDRYGWKLTYLSFIDHLAFLFAHELHHFRRYHLGFHEREGENMANKWALARIQQLSFNAEGVKLTQSPKKKKSSRFLFSNTIFDPYKKFRSLAAGDKLLIKYDSKGHYQNEIVSVIRPIRKNSKRIVVETNDGKQWRWPLEWIAIVR